MHTWEAVYSDGTIVREPANYHQLDRHRLSMFKIMKGSVPVLSIELQDGMRLIHRRRWFHFMTTTGEQTKVCVTLVGWQQTKQGVNVQALFWLMPDGTVMVTDRFREGHAMWGEVELIADSTEEWQ